MWAAIRVCVWVHRAEKCCTSLSRWSTFRFQVWGNNMLKPTRYLLWSLTNLTIKLRKRQIKSSSFLLLLSHRINSAQALKAWPKTKMNSECMQWRMWYKLKLKIQLLCTVQNKLGIFPSRENWLWKRPSTPMTILFDSQETIACASTKDLEKI